MVHVQLEIPVCSDSLLTIVIASFMMARDEQNLSLLKIGEDANQPSGYNFPK